MLSGAPGRAIPSVDDRGMGRFGKPLRAARVTAALDSVRYLLHLEQLGEPPLQQREWWPVRGSYAAAYLSANARTHQVTPSLCHRTMGFDRGDICLGFVERDAPGPRPGSPPLL